ncbi:MAG: zinc ribbon domain-containing protein [Anaerolineae bacterium]|nr:zinc ribbon domain-containing protein [Anaerolineae bacterium]
MPLFEYTCPGCGRTFEKLVRSAQTERDFAECPTCGNPYSARQISVIAVRGTGSHSSGAVSLPSSGSL